MKHCAQYLQTVEELINAFLMASKHFFLLLKTDLVYSELDVLSYQCNPHIVLGMY